MSVEDLKTKREAWRAQVNRLCDIIEGYFKSPDLTEVQIREAHKKLAAVNKISPTLDLLDGQIEVLLVADQYGDEFAERCDYVSKISDINELVTRKKEELTRAKVIGDNLRSAIASLRLDDVRGGGVSPRDDLTEESSQSGGNASSGRSDVSKKDKKPIELGGGVSSTFVKVPQIEIEPFHGEFQKWKSFWNQFNYAVGRHKSISGADKLHLLISFLRGAPLALVQDLDLDDDNYVVAIDLLTSRYGSEKNLRDQHIDALDDLETLDDEEDLEAIRELENELRIHVMALIGMKFDVGIFFTRIRLLFPKDFIKLFRQDERESKTVLEFLDFVQSEVVEREKWQRRKVGPNSRPGSRSRVQTKERLRTTTSMVTTNADSESGNRRVEYCLFCDVHTHWARECMAKISLARKREILDAKSKCWQCLKSGHITEECTFPFRCCGRCGGTHFVVMCTRHPHSGVDGGESSKGRDEIRGEPRLITSMAAHVASTKQEVSVLLQTARVYVVHENRRMEVLCLLDSGSQHSFVQLNIVEQLRLPRICYETVHVQGFAAQDTEGQFPRVRLNLQGISTKRELTIEALGIQTLTNFLAPAGSIEVDRLVSQLRRKGLEVADPYTPGQDREIHIILGMDYLNYVITGPCHDLTADVRAHETIFGWTISGTVGLPKTEGRIHSVACLVAIDVKPVVTDLEQDLRKLWELDVLGMKEGEGVIHLNEFDDNFRKAMRREEGGYCVSLPWLPGKREMLKSNRNAAVHRFKATVRRLLRDPVQFERYHRAISEYEEKGYAEVVDEQTEVSDEIIYYLPHHPVISEGRNTKIRIVFDASSHEKNQLSLNDCLFEGTNRKLDIIKVLLNFRVGTIGWAADLQKAFLQIKIDPVDQDVFRYFWVDPSHPTSEYLKRPRVLKMNRVIFGMTSSPYLLRQTIVEHCKGYSEVYPESVNQILKSFYVDDLVLSEEGKENMDQRQKEVTQIMEEAGFNLHKSVTNAQGGNVTKVLGLKWYPNTDELSVIIPPVREAVMDPITKRGLVRGAAMIFDPLGIISPIVIRAKMLIQEVWRRNTGWDESISEYLLPVWHRWLLDIEKTDEWTFDRRLTPGSSRPLLRDGEFEIHGFADASLRAYGTVFYVVYLGEEGTRQSSLLMSKFRVAPLKTLTLPRLELLAATLMSRVTIYLKMNFCNPSRWVFWTDSAVVYYWIHKPSIKTTTYVTNRVHEIRTNTHTEEWRHCPGSDNPADLATRENSVDILTKEDVWWIGPRWIRSSSEFWPVTKVNCDQFRFAEEVLSVHVARVSIEEVKTINNIIDLSSFSSKKRLIRITSWVIKAVRAFQRVQVDVVDCYSMAECLWDKDCQTRCFSKEIELLREVKLCLKNSTIFKLRPYLDNKGLIRVQGRLQFSKLKDEVKHPIVLPKNDAWTFLCIQEVHQKLHHAGVSTTLTVLRQKYWILSGRKTCQRCIRRCLICERFLEKKMTPPIAPLPEERVELVHPFRCVGVDFAGPGYVRELRGQVVFKMYIVIFTCAASRAVHLEVTSDLSTDRFLMAFRRFCSRRGVPSVVYSDNALQFKKASKVVRCGESDICLQSVKRVFAEQHIQWRFIAERAPWWGGFWERLVRSIKEPLRRVLGRAVLSYEEMETVVVEIEAVINSRPLSAITEDVDDGQVLTPAHLLLGEPLTRLEVLDEPKGKQSGNLVVEYITRKRLLTKLIGDWREQYLLQLRSAHLEMVSPEVKLRSGQLVLIKDPAKSKHLWNLARIVETIKGRDGVIRSCNLKLAGGKRMCRPVNLILPLEGTNEEDHKNHPLPPGIVKSVSMIGGQS